MNEHGHSGYEPTREDVLIGRVTDGEAGPGDWTELERIAERDAGVWRRLANAQRAHARLSHAVEDAIAVAELIDLPARPPGAALRRMRQWGGWAIAAVVALAWLGSTNGVIALPGGTGANRAGLADFGSVSNPDAALQQYITAGTAEGRVLAEMPAVLVEVQPSGDPDTGLQEVVFIRQILERQRVRDPKVLGFVVNERGQRVPRLEPARNVTAPSPM